MKKVILLVMGAILLTYGASAAAFLEPDEVKEDIVQTQNKRVNGKIIRENYLNTIIKSNNKEIKVPHAVIVAVYFKGANNEAWIAGLTAFQEHNYQEAFNQFDAASRSANNLQDGRPYFLERINYFKGLCCYYLGEFDAAEKFLNSALRREDATFKFEGEYYSGRVLEAKGAFEKANTKYSTLLKAVYPKLIANKPLGAEKWQYLCTLGQDRTQVLVSSSKDGQEDKLKEAAEKFNATFKKGDKFLDDELKMGAVQIKACALKYLAKKDNGKYPELIKELDEPLRDAAAANDRNNLSWMYLDRADSYFGMMGPEKNWNKKREYAEAALLDYMRLAYGYQTIPAEMAKSFYRIGNLLEFLKGDDYVQRALTHYRRATSSQYKSMPIFDTAMKARKNLEEKAPELEKKAKEAKAKAAADKAAAAKKAVAAKPAPAPAKNAQPKKK